MLFYNVYMCSEQYLYINYIIGSTVYFPSKLHSKEYAQKKIAENMDRLNVRELAKLTGYSERSVRRMINEINDDE